VGWACFRSELVAWQGSSRKFFDSSDGVKRSFCNQCGTSLSYQSAGDTLDLPIATLDNPEAIRPEREVYLSHRISWNAHDEEIRGYQKFKSDEQNT
ncbi:MAG TPA: GFA family protein, partial [Xanthomonadales bacterium]|nr:GFA family protein [Xanthomonadales bacterium]